MNTNIIIANSNPLHTELEAYYRDKYSAHIINNKEDFNISAIKKLNPTYIFFPHWSFIIPKEIYECYECVVFHMTDLPYGRGGSPLQNLIVRGHENTKISALKVEKGIDTGDIYMKRDLNLNGSAEEIFLRSGVIVKEMIEEILTTSPVPQPQRGEVLEFRRRKPNDGDISKLDGLRDLYDYIRMLDAEGYPSAFIELDSFKLEFSRASLKNDKIVADVRIIKK